MTTFHKQENWLNWIDELSMNDYVLIEDFLPDTLYHQVRKFFQERISEFDQAGIGAMDLHQIKKGIRGDLTYWLDSKREHSLKAFWSLVEEMIYSLNRYCFLSISGFEFHLANYPPGSFYKQHIDQFKERNNRLISVVIYLNEGWNDGDGGELELTDSKDNTVLIKPKGKRCVLFKSAKVPHAVLETNKNRYSLTGWLLYHPAALGQILG